MAIKKAEKSKADEATYRRNKVKTSVDNQVIVIDDGENDDGSCSGLPTKVKVKKKKDLVKSKDSYQKGTKKKKRKEKSYSDIKNKAHADLPIIVIESSSDSEFLMKNGEIAKITKKKGEGRLLCEGDGKCVVLSKGLAREQQGANFLIRESGKKKSPGSHGDGEECIRKKKKKKKHQPACSLMLDSEDHEVESQKQIIPNVKTISQDTMLSGRKRRWTPVKNHVSNTVKKKKLQDHLIAGDNEESSDGISDERIANPVDQLQEENHCEGRTLDRKAHQDSAAQVPEETRVIRKKWKKKKPPKEKVSFFVILAKTQENNSGASNENLLKPKSRETQVFQKEKMDLILGAGRVTKKKTSRTKVVSSHVALLDANEDALAVEERKKKVKKDKAIQECTVSVNSGTCENKGKQHVKKKKKKKNKDKGSVDDYEEDLSLKKRRLKNKTKAREDEVKVVAFKKGNCDEISIDKSRRQALQEEIDRESGKTKVIKEEGESESHFGQWNTAVFESSERKAKFLRLMGGFKKGFSVSAQDPPVHSTKLNMAPDWSREQNLQRDLEAEFEKAVDRKHHRGIGLGFQPATQRHTQIDKCASKSIKFED